MKTTRKKIVALIPCYNEEGGIETVIKSFAHKRLKKHGFELEVIVIDNNSDDRTAEIAREHGATVIHVAEKGKGNAIRAGFNYISEDTDYVVMLDGDDTYRPEEILRLVEPLDSKFCNVVVGSRLGGRISEGSMEALNRAGNWIFSHLVRYIYRVNVTDALTGYFAWTREAVHRLRPHLVSEGFAIEMEMVTKMARLGEEIYSVPISYNARAGDSHLRPIYDGSRILWMLVKNFFWKPEAEKIKRVAFVSDAIMPYNYGGKEKRLYEISRRLVKKGREVHIYTMQWWEGPKTIEQDGVYFHAICKLHPLYHSGRRSMSEAIYFSLAVFKLLFVRFDVLDVDHIPFFPLFSARIVAWLRGKKLYATWHEVWGSEYWRTYLSGPSGFIGAWIERLAFKLPDTIIANSRYTAKRLVEVGVRCEIKTVSLGADLKSIYDAEPEIEKSDVIYVGRLLSHKGVDLLVHAIKIVKESFSEIKVLIVGSGPETHTLSDLIHKLGLQDNITIRDQVDANYKLYGLMKSSKMLVLPSIREGFGLVVVEAMAAGIPVITTRHKNNAARDLVVEGVNGLLVEPIAEDIAEKILKLMRNPTQMRPQSNIEKYDWQHIMKGLENAFGQI